MLIKLTCSISNRNDSCRAKLVDSQKFGFAHKALGKPSEQEGILSFIAQQTAGNLTLSA